MTGVRGHQPQSHCQPDRVVKLAGCWRMTAPDLDRLLRIVKRRLKKIPYRPHLISGYLTATCLTIEAW